METKIKTHTLTDGSEVYDVYVYDKKTGEIVCTFHAENLISADDISTAINSSSVGVTSNHEIVHESLVAIDLMISAISGGADCERVMELVRAYVDRASRIVNASVPQMPERKQTAA